jgi:hypothetical protein
LKNIGNREGREGEGGNDGDGADVIHATSNLILTNHRRFSEWFEIR